MAQSASREADVVVVGYGGAGATAAITAHDAGASVLVLEKASEGGGNTRYSGGSLRRLVDRAGAVEHLEALSLHSTPHEVLWAYVNGHDEALEWLESLGAELGDWGGVGGFPPTRPVSPYPEIPHAQALGKRTRVRPKYPGEAGGDALWDVLDAAVREREIDVLLNASAQRLVQEPQTSEIKGVVAEYAEGILTVHARRAVILACGGFSYDQAMQRDFIGRAFPAFGPPGGNTGDGVRMAQAAGASLWHMGAYAPVLGYVVPGYEAAFQYRMPAGGYIFVDQSGRRFVDEAGLDNHSLGMAIARYAVETVEFTDFPIYVIFDERTRTAGPITNVWGGFNRRVGWSQDNSREIELGWIKRSTSLEGLASQFGIAANTLIESVSRYNRSCQEGRDGEIGRPAELLAPLEAPPYYGIEARLTMLNTQGGPRRNEHAEILDPYGVPIPGLYGAGELGSIWGGVYGGSLNVSECLVYGRIAGRNAAKRLVR